MRVYNRHFPAEWLLQKYEEDGSTTFVRIDEQIVNVVFGPYAKVT